jgi:hypothetical protein
MLLSTVEPWEERHAIANRRPAAAPWGTETNALRTSILSAAPSRSGSTLYGQRSGLEPAIGAYAVRDRPDFSRAGSGSGREAAGQGRQREGEVAVESLLFLLLFALGRKKGK